MLAALGIVIVLVAVLVALAARLAAIPLFAALSSSFGSWADASRHGGEWSRER